MADDIVGRLRQMAKANGCEAGMGCSEAADEIERLRAAGDVLAEWTAVDHSVEQCEDGCEYFAALRAWQEARRG